MDNACFLLAYVSFIAPFRFETWLGASPLLLQELENKYSHVRPEKPGVGRRQVKQNIFGVGLG